VIYNGGSAGTLTPALDGNSTRSFLETMTQNWRDARAKVKDAADGLGRRSRRPLVGQRRWQDSGQGRSRRLVYNHTKGYVI
jgi:hypothetical protein